MSPFKAELLALLMAVSEAQARGLEQVIFESNSLLVVARVGDPTLLFNDNIGCTFEAIQEMASSSPLWSFHKVSRQVNASANTLAKWAANRKCVGCIPLDCLPTFLVKIDFVFRSFLR